MTTPSDPDEIAKQAREHAWSWFALHGTQRMQVFNFFVVATAFLIAAYASLLEKHPAAALVLAISGAWLTFWFNRLEARSRQLVKAGERALAAPQVRLASLTENPDLKYPGCCRSNRCRWLLVSPSDQHDSVDDLCVVSSRRCLCNLARSPWLGGRLWTLDFGYHEDRMPTHGYAETPEAAMIAFAKSWRRE